MQMQGTSDLKYLDALTTDYLTTPESRYLASLTVNPNIGMTIDADGLALVKAFEGCERSVGNGNFTTYFDSVGVLTLGWGHTNLGNVPPHISQGDVWTQAQCDAALVNDMARFDADVIRLFPNYKLTPYQFAALTSFDFNTGALARSSIPAKINAGDLQGAMATLLLYNHAGGQVLAGLTRRRRAEMLLFNGDVQSALILAGAHASIGRRSMAKASMGPSS
jgi:lysozyme